MVKVCSSADAFNAALKEAGDKLVVVDFYATWCGPCKMIAPEIEKMEASMSDVVFLKVDVDENDETAQEYNISCMPTFLFFKGEKKVHEFAGASKEKLEAEIARLK